MTRRKAKSRVGEPVQVYLAVSDSERLHALAKQLGASKSDVLRQGLAALEREVSNPDRNPLLRLIGVIKSDTSISNDGRDLAREHDAFLSDALESSKKARAAQRKHRSS